MNYNLYPQFERWRENGCIWLFSDPHFEDSDCKLIDENWVTPEEQVRLINSKVGKKDTLIILGDIGNPRYIQQLKGYKVLIKGNHDKGLSIYKKWYTPLVNKEGKEYFRHNYMFDEVYEGPLFISEKILLSHEPIKLDFGINIHGHNHEGVEVQYWNQEEKLDINVCANVINYIPIRLDKLIWGYKTKDIHRTIIDDAIKRKEKRNGKK